MSNKGKVNLKQRIPSKQDGPAKNRIALSQDNYSTKKGGAVLTNYEIRNYNLDLIKAICITLVLFWHLQPLQLSVDPASTVGTTLSLSIYIFYYQICLIAVPTFIMVSIYLFLFKIQTNVAYLIKREKKLLSLLLFWMSIQYVLFLCIFKFNSDFQFNTDQLNISNLLTLRKLFMGGPDLPLVGGSVFYYLVVMVALFFITFSFMKIQSNRIKSYLSISLITAGLLFFEYINLKRVNIIYFRLDNFLIYIPIVYLAWQYPQRFNAYKYIYLLGYVIFILHDMKMGVVSYYSRVSVCLGAMTLFAFINSWNFKEHKYAQFLSKYSLGIFALHKYWQFILILAFVKLFKYYDINQIIDFPTIQIGRVWLYSGLLTIPITIVTAFLLGKTFLRRFVC